MFHLRREIFIFEVLTDTAAVNSSFSAFTRKHSCQVDFVYFVQPLRHNRKTLNLTPIQVLSYCDVLVAKAVVRS